MWIAIRHIIQFGLLLKKNSYLSPPVSFNANQTKANWNRCIVENCIVLNEWRRTDDNNKKKTKYIMWEKERQT